MTDRDKEVVGHSGNEQGRKSFVNGEEYRYQVDKNRE